MILSTKCGGEVGDKALCNKMSGCECYLGPRLDFFHSQEI